jgi:hypothetical protein
VDPGAKLAVVACSALVVASIGCSEVAPSAGSGPPEAPPQCENVDSDPAVDVDFHATIRPLFNRRLNNPAGPGCSECHYPLGDLLFGITQGQLDLSTLGTLRKGGLTSGVAIVVPGCPCDSALVQKLLGVYPPDTTQMPKWAPRAWTPAEIQVVIDWIAEGAQGADSE